MKITLPDGKEKELNASESGYDVALSISPSLAKKAIAYSLNGSVYDLKRPIPEGGEFKLILEGDPESYSVLNHSTSHLMAHAIAHLFKNARFGFGPSIDEGFYYDVDFETPINDEDLKKIEKEMHRIASQALPIVREEIDRDEARELFKDNPYKLELIDGIEGTISVYRQGDFVDLCAGPHLEKTSQIKHFKLLSLAGAYWRGNSKNKQLTRIYGTSFFKESELENHLKLLEERKKRDHKRIGKELGLFMISEYGPGLPFWLPNGYTLRRVLEDWWLDVHRKNGYLIVETPIMLSRTLWETSGHWDHYHEDMYTLKVDEEDFAIKPMNCPGAILCYKNDLHSYRELPLRYAELGHVHRHEASGALNGLFRVRTFTQDDAHILLSEDQIADEVTRILKLYDEIYSVFHLDYAIELSTRPEENYIGDIEVWDQAEKALTKVCVDTGHPFKINPGDGAFYGPKLDFKLKDSMNRIWQCGTIQLDMQLPGRFDCSYIDSDGQKKTPVMIHRAIFGSLERFIAILTENFAGAYPTWLSPVQVSILPVSETHMDYSLRLKATLEEHRIRCSIDAPEEKLGYRLRQAQMHKVPYTLVIGDKEVEAGTLTYRLYAHQEQITIGVEAFLRMIEEEIETKALRK